jgi:hypothetical protein
MKVLQVCTGRAQTLRAGGREVLSAIAKAPVAGPVAVGPLGLEGDEQADLSVHGGLAKAVYAYPSEHLAFWQTVRAQAQAAPWGQALPAGAQWARTCCCRACWSATCGWATAWSSAPPAAAACWW